MKLSVERNPGSIAVLDITADDDEFNEALTVAYRKVSRDIQLPGFRKGKAPRALIERAYGPDVFTREAADEIMEKLYRQALQQENLTPVGDPEVEIKDLAPVNFVVTVPVYPTLELGDYSGVRVDPVDATVEESEVDEVLTRLQRSSAAWVDPTEPRPAQDGDQVTVDYEVKDGDVDFQEPVSGATFILGETNLLTQFREQLTGMQVGETADFDISFDEDDETTDPSIRGKTLAYHLTVTSIKERDIRPIDDEFAKEVADVDTVDELRRQIRDDIHQGKTNDARQNVLDKIVAGLSEVTTLDLPEVMIHEEVHHQIEHLQQDLTRDGTSFEEFLRMQGKTESSLHDELWPESERRLRQSMILREVANRENVEVTDEDLDAEVDRLVNQNFNRGENTEEAEANIARMREIYRSDYFRNMLQSELFDRKLTDHLIDLATEGRGAVINGWVAPEPKPAAIDAEGDLTTTEAAEEAADHTFAEAAGEETPEDAAQAAEAFEETATEAAEETADRTFGEAAGEVTPERAAQAASVFEETSPGAAEETATEAAEEAADHTFAEAAGEETPASAAEAAAAFQSTEAAAAATAPGEGTDWVAGDGENNVPDGFPIKGNASSRIYHTRESPSYERTIAEIYFASPEAAEAAGYRLPKSMQAAAEKAISSAADAAAGAEVAEKSENE